MGEDEQYTPPESNYLQERGIFTETGRYILKAPEEELIKKYVGNERIEYFPAQVPEKIRGHYPFRDADVNTIAEQDQLWTLYNLCFLNQLERHLSDTLKEGERVGIRGTACSIDGEINEGDLHIKDLFQTLNDGTEKEGDQTLITDFSNEDPEIHHRTTQWLIKGVQELRAKFALRQDMQEKIFPIIIIYRLEGLKPLGLYEVKLPTVPEDRANIIKKIYILDYPTSKKELLGK